MKSVTLILASLILGSSVHAQSAATGNVVRKTILEKDVTINVEVGSKRIKETILGYSRPTVKVIVPELAEHTLMNHRNEGEDGPCLASQAQDVEDVIQGKPAIEPAVFHITETQELSVGADNLCRVLLIENVETKIRGIKFVHQRISGLPSRIAEDCK